MTHTSDIIGVVKELQVRLAERGEKSLRLEIVHFGTGEVAAVKIMADCNDEVSLPVFVHQVPNVYDAVLVAQFATLLCDIRNHYPVTAEALVIAMDSLKRIDGNGQNDDCGYSEIANEALSRIRSLPIRH